jgi:predicted DNA-binding protein (UPF0251 family)
MPRPIKCRRVSFFPQVTLFKPAGVPLKALEEVRLSMEEVEAIRLKDLEGLEQEQGAVRMNVSRPTFQRVLTSARQKIAAALLEGKAIRIEGGSFEISPCHFKCCNSHEWDVPFEIAINTLPQSCPTCNVTEITCSHQFGKECGNTGHIRCCQIDRLPNEKAESSEIRK